MWSTQFFDATFVVTRKAWKLQISQAFPMRGSHTFQTSFQSAVQIHDFHVFKRSWYGSERCFLEISRQRHVILFFLRTLSINFWKYTFCFLLSIYFLLTRKPLSLFFNLVIMIFEAVYLGFLWLIFFCVLFFVLLLSLLFRLLFSCSWQIQR